MQQINRTNSTEAFIRGRCKWGLVCVWVSVCYFANAFLGEDRLWILTLSVLKSPLEYWHLFSLLPVCIFCWSLYLQSSFHIYSSVFFTLSPFSFLTLLHRLLSPPYSRLSSSPSLFRRVVLGRPAPVRRQSPAQTRPVQRLGARQQQGRVGMDTSPPAPSPSPPALTCSIPPTFTLPEIP